MISWSPPGASSRQLGAHTRFHSLAAGPIPKRRCITCFWNRRFFHFHFRFLILSWFVMSSGSPTIRWKMAWYRIQVWSFKTLRICWPSIPEKIYISFRWAILLAIAISICQLQTLWLVSMLWLTGVFWNILVSTKSPLILWNVKDGYSCWFSQFVCFL